MGEGDNGLTGVRWAACSALSAVVFLLGGCGGTSVNPTPTVSALYPETVPATLVGPPQCTSAPSPFTLNVTGNNFMTTSVAYWNGSKRATTFNQNSGELAVTILACDIANPGINYVSVVNPPPGGGPSQAAAPFQVTQPTPAAIKSLSPASTTQNVLPPGGTLTVNGAAAESGSSSAAFAFNSQVLINGEARATTYVSSTQLQVQLLPADVAVVGGVSVTVTNPGRGGSSMAHFSVTDPPNAANFPRVISVSATGGAANGASSSPAMSADGRYIAFYSEATNLVTSSASGNIFVRDTCIGAAASCSPHTIAVDLAPDGSAPNADAGWKLAISGDGRFVAFSSGATNLLDPEAAKPARDAVILNVFVRDMCVGPTTPSACTPRTLQVSQSPDGTGGDADSAAPSLSFDGRFVAFKSFAGNLISGGHPGAGPRIYVTDLCTVASSNQCSRGTWLVSAGTPDSGDLSGDDASISADGRYVGFAGWTVARHDGYQQIFLRDTCLGDETKQPCAPLTMPISVSQDGECANSNNQDVSVSRGGRFVTFESTASNLLAGLGASPGMRQVLVRDTCLGADATCIPATNMVVSGNPDMSRALDTFGPTITPSGRYIGFFSIFDSADRISHALVRDTCVGKQNSQCVSDSALASVTTHGELGNNSSYPQIAISADGRVVAFTSDATNLASPTSGFGDVFLTQIPIAPAQH